MSVATDLPGTPNEETATRFGWRVWPLRDAAPGSLLMVPVLVLTGLAIQWYAQNSVATLGAMGLLLFSLWRFFLPVRYDIDGSGITQSVLRRRTHIPWHAFDRCDIRKSGLQLHRTHAVAPIDALGSYFLPFGSHRGEILPLALQWMQYAHRSHHRRETRW